jgi:hypothetical protein
MAFTIQRNVGMLLLAIWLILSGVAGMMPLGLPAPLMSVLALLAGVLILVGRYRERYRPRGVVAGSV